MEKNKRSQKKSGRTFERRRDEDYSRGSRSQGKAIKGTSSRVQLETVRSQLPMLLQTGKETLETIRNKLTTIEWIPIFLKFNIFLQSWLNAFFVALSKFIHGHSLGGSPLTRSMGWWIICIHIMRLIPSTYFSYTLPTWLDNSGVQTSPENNCKKRGEKMQADFDRTKNCRHAKRAQTHTRTRSYFRGDKKSHMAYHAPTHSPQSIEPSSG